MRHQRAALTASVVAHVALLLACASSAAADDPHANLRCLANFAMLTGSTEGAAKTSATLGVIYFLGRLDDQTPGFDIETSLEKLFDTETEAAIESDLGRCKAILQERGQALIKAGAALQKHGQ